jgi:hypothetical protein
VLGQEGVIAALLTLDGKAKTAAADALSKAIGTPAASILAGTVKPAADAEPSGAGGGTQGRVPPAMQPVKVAAAAAAASADKQSVPILQMSATTNKADRARKVHRQGPARLITDAWLS